MRPAFAEQLDELERRLVGYLGDGANTLETVAAAARAPSPSRTGAIAKDADALRAGANRAHADLVVVAARQTPVAGDLRLVMSMIELSHHVVLVANQFTQISEQLVGIDPNTFDDQGGAERLATMSGLASGVLRKATTAFHTRDLATARELERDDDAIDTLNRTIFEAAARAEVSVEQRELALRHVLIARCLERIGDNAVDIAEQAVFLLTAEVTQFSDASRPSDPL
jgi:phosphate transport system protein